MRATDLARVIITLEAMGKNPQNVSDVNLFENYTIVNLWHQIHLIVQFGR